MLKINRSSCIASAPLKSANLIARLGLLSLLATGINGCGSTTSSTQAVPPASAAPAQAAVAPSSYTVKDVSNGGSIEGQVVLTGKPIPPRPVLVNQDASVCGSHRVIYPVKVEKDGIVDAVVWIDNIHEGKEYDFPPAVLDQKKCTYDPHIVLMQPGDLKVTTSDPIPHNVHSYSESNRTYNESMNPLNRQMTFHFARSERITFKCDLHGWMEAFIIVASNPYYAITGPGGAFRLTNIPPGTYHLKAWQETLGETTQDITVEAGKSVNVKFRLDSATSERAEAR